MPRTLVKFEREPTLIIQSGVASVVIAELAALHLPTWAHTVVTVVVIGMGAIFNRSKVTPRKDNSNSG